MMVGRKTKYTPEMHAEIIRLLADGCLIQDICAAVGISEDTYFQWIKRHPEFSEATTRAKGEALTHAVETLRVAMRDRDVTSKTAKTFTETRLRRVRHKDGSIVDEPYTYTREEKSGTITHELGDWRAALEFLRRRDPKNWTEQLIIKVDPADLELLEKMGFKSPSEAWMTLMENARATYAESTRN